MANRNGQLILYILEKSNSPVDKENITNLVAHTVGASPSDVLDTVEETLDAGVELGFIHQNNAKYYTNIKEDGTRKLQNNQTKTISKNGKDSNTNKKDEDKDKKSKELDKNQTASKSAPIVQRKSSIKQTKSKKSNQSKLFKGASNEKNTNRINPAGSIKMKPKSVAVENQIQMLQTNGVYGMRNGAVSCSCNCHQQKPKSKLFRNIDLNKDKYESDEDTGDDTDSVDNIYAVYSQIELHSMVDSNDNELSDNDSTGYGSYQ